MHRPSWRYCSGIYLPKHRWTIYRDDNLKVQLQIVVRRRGLRLSTREKRYYFIDGKPGVFRVEEKMLRTLQADRYRKTHPLRYRTIWERILFPLRLFRMAFAGSRRHG
jgi:hypothetical protein